MTQHRGSGDGQARGQRGAFMRERRRRNIAIALALAAFVALAFFATMAKLALLMPAG